MRSFLISHRVLTPEWKHYQPPGWDLLQHFAFYGPYGLFAGLLGSLIRRWKGVQASQVVEVLALGFGFAAALVDEMRQEGLVDRRPGFDDLFSGWAGIAVIFALYLLMAHLLNRNKLRRMKLTSNESGTIVSK
ncbi:hypothetical protein IT570_09090 [Candidatus Sumerlaeota bacterium]|nr:hypothetical protein [Candidatus Sumerlaeota bacterium]